MANTTNRINQQPQVLLQTELIQDPVARHNFDILNQELRKRRQGQEPPAVNGSFSPIAAFHEYRYDSTARRTFPPELVVTQGTRGNPIIVKLVAATISSEVTYRSFFTVFSPSLYNIDLTVGYLRAKINPGEALDFQIAMAQAVALDIHTLNSPDSVFLEFPLPLFELVDDQVSAGLYQYKFFFNLSTLGSTRVTVNQVRLFAHELR
jgi:hypothetical protein